MKYVVACLFALSTLGMSAAARATDYTWLGPASCVSPCVPPGGGAWTTASNWSPAGVPGSGDTATVIGNGQGTTGISGASASGLTGLTLDGKVSISDGTLGVTSGVLHWTSGVLGSGVVITLGPLATGLIDGDVELAGTELDNAGTLAWVGGMLKGDSDAIIRNSGTFNVTPGLTVLGYGGGLNSCNFFNTGTLALIASGTVTNTGNGVGVWGFHNTGVVSLATGSVLELQSASDTQHTLDGGGSVTGGGTLLFDEQGVGNPASVVTINGTTSVASGATLAFGPGSRVNQGTSGGTIAGPGTLLWTGGNIIGNASGNTAPALNWGSTLKVHMTGAAQKDMTTAYIVSGATVTWDQGSFGGGDGSYFMNNAPWTIAGDLSIAVGGTSTNYDAVFENHSTVTKTAGTGVLTVDRLALLNYGTLRAASGSVLLDTAGQTSPDILEAGSTLDGAFVAYCEVDLNGASAIASGGSLELGNNGTAAARFEGSGTINGPGTVKLDGSLVYATAGKSITFGASGQVALTANAAVTSFQVDVTGALTFAGTTTWTGGELWLDGDVTNSGSWTAKTPGLFTRNSGYTFTNSGTFTADPGAGTTVTIELNHFATSGTVVCKSGTMDFDLSGAFVQTAGLTSLAGGSLAAKDAAMPPNLLAIDIQGGSLAGAGTIDANLTNEGTVAPGTSTAAGTLSVTGTYVQSGAGKLGIGLGGTVAGTGFDVLAVAGTVSIAGELDVARIGGYVPSVGDAYRVLTSGATSPGDTGTFATVTQPTGVTLTTTYDPSDVTLGVTMVNIPEAGAPDAGEAGASDGGAVDAGSGDAGGNDAGGSDASAMDGGGDDGGSLQDGSLSVDATADGGATAPGASKGCSCDVVGAGAASGTMGMLGVLGGVVGAAVRRRRRGSKA